MGVGRRCREIGRERSKRGYGWVGGWVGRCGGARVRMQGRRTDRVR